MTHLLYIATASLILFTTLLPTSAQADSKTWHRSMRQALQNEVTSSGLTKSGLGIWVGEVKGEELLPIYTLNNNKQFVPASLSKIPTAAAVLKSFAPDIVFKTEVLATTPVQNGVLRGDIFLRGGGDPAFVSEKMWFLVNELRREGITAIAGDLIVDDNRFDKKRSSRRTTDPVDRAYDAPIGALSFNWNSVNVYVRPGDKVGERAKVIIDPVNDYIQVRNTAKTKSAGRRTIQVSRKRINSRDVIEVSGKIALGADEMVSYKNITEPDIWTGYNFKEFLRQRGIVVQGQVKAGVTPAAARILAVNESKPLRQIIADMSKFSNNFVAEMLTKNLAAEAGESPATLGRGVELINNKLVSMGLSRNTFEFNNPSGLSTDNKFTPGQISTLLFAAHKDFSFYPEFLTALPIAGVDGTLKKRMSNSTAERWVRAKTGLLNGVAALAGYAGRPDGTLIIFSFIYNGSQSLSHVRNTFDQMAVQLTSGATLQ